MSGDTTVEDEYEYPGWLVFNGLYKSSVHGEGSVSPQDVVDNFDEYTPGSPNEPHAGFAAIELPEKLRQMRELSEATEKFAQGLHSFRYIDEDWVEQLGYDSDGNEAMFFRPDHDEVRVYWDYVNDVIIFKGGKRLLERKQDDLMAALSDNVEMATVTFDFDFFLWILYKQHQGEQLSDDIRVREITRSSTAAETKGNLGVGSVDSNNVLRSVLLIASVLSGKKINKIKGDFIMGDYRLEALIEFGGKVHIQVTDSPLSTLSNLRRMGIALRFLSQIVNLYDDWKRLDSEERYPPPSFFDEIAENAEEEGWELLFDPEDVKARYERKRQETRDGTSNTVAAEDAS